MTKQIQRDTVRLTKSGQIHSQDLKKIPSIYMSEYERALRGWEFLAMCEGKESPRAIEANKSVNFFLSMYHQAYAQVFGA